MKTAEQVLAEVAALLAEAGLTVEHLPKPEHDRLTLAARECIEVTNLGVLATPQEKLAKIRAIIAREVAAAEPSDAAIRRVIHLIGGQDFVFGDVRATLKGEGA